MVYLMIQLINDYIDRFVSYVDVKSLFPFLTSEKLGEYLLFDFFFFVDCNDNFIGCDKRGYIIFVFVYLFHS